jgi:hypothetical protein
MNIISTSATDEIKRRLSPRELLQNLGAKLRPRHRADCPVPGCIGAQKGTVSYHDTWWKCFRCDNGGDVFSLVEKVRDCDFLGAMRYLAPLAGVSLPTRMSPTTVKNEWHWKRQRFERDRQRRTTESICDRLEAEERELRRTCLDWIGYCNKVLEAPGPWSETRWQLARTAFELRDEFLSHEYCLLSYAAMSERDQYLRSSECRRALMVHEVRRRGGVTAQNGRFIPVAQE